MTGLPAPIDASTVTLTQVGDLLLVTAPAYTVTLAPTDGRLARLERDGLIADLYLVSACDPAEGLDEPGWVSPPTVTAEDGVIRVEVASGSTFWAEKRYTLTCYPDHLEYGYVVVGRGRIDNVGLLAGNRPGRLSRPGFRSVFNPEPNGDRKHLFGSGEYATIGIRSDRRYYRGNWFFTPGPFVYALGTGNGWVAAALGARPGEYRFSDFEYTGQAGGFGFNLGYEGYTTVDGVWESPRLALLFGEGDEYDAIRWGCDWARLRGYAPVPAGRAPAAWWQGPIFCGWGAQCYVGGRNQSDAASVSRAATDRATQDDYEGFIGQLAARHLVPGIVVIDDKWMDCYGDPRPDPAKWPDLPGFIGRQHDAGRRVLLWLKAWDAEGLPPEECILDRDGTPIAVDPTSGAYERRLRAVVRRLLGEYDADGFKLDFTHRVPAGPGCRLAGDLWGVELLRRLVFILADELHRTKPEALLIAHTANPYFADLVDMLRLNDIAVSDEAIQSGQDSYLSSMAVRAKVARAVAPTWLIDADNAPSPTVAAWREYMRAQPALGVPSLYYTSHLCCVTDGGDRRIEEIDEAAWQELREIWTQYRRATAEPQAE